MKLNARFFWWFLTFELSSNKEAFEMQIKEQIKTQEKIAKGIDSLLDNKKYNELSGINIT